MTARHRDLEYLDDDYALIPQQISSVSSDVNGQTLTVQDYNSPQSAKFVCMLNSANSSDSIDFILEESTDGGSSWTENSSYSVSGLDDATSKGVIEVDNLQDLAADVRVKLDSNNSSLSSANVEIGVAAVFGGRKTA